MIKLMINDNIHELEIEPRDFIRCVAKEAGFDGCTHIVR